MSSHVEESLSSCFLPRRKLAASQSHSVDFEGERTQFRSSRGTKVLTVHSKISLGMRSAPYQRDCTIGFDYWPSSIHTFSPPASVASRQRFFL